MKELYVIIKNEDSTWTYHKISLEAGTYGINGVFGNGGQGHPVTTLNIMSYQSVDQLRKTKPFLKSFHVFNDIGDSLGYIDISQFFDTEEEAKEECKRRNNEN